MRLQGKVAVVTGASSGMGRATAALFAREGARVVVTANTNLRGGTEAVDMIRAAGGEAMVVQVDVASSKSVQDLVATTLSHYGKIDVLFNNAGAMRLLMEKDRSVSDLPEDVWDLMIDVMLKGTYLCCKHVIPHMIEQRSGSIINNGSVDASIAGAGFDSYTAAKGGVISMTRSMAVGYGQYGIRVNCISPGVVATEVAADFLDTSGLRSQVEDLHILGLGQPDDVAYLALYLASDESRWMTGANLFLDGGYSIMKTSVPLTASAAAK